MIRAMPSFATMMLLGLISRWKMPCSWALARPDATWLAICRASGSGKPRGNLFPKRDALVERHGDEHVTVRGFVDIVDHDDVGVIQGRRGARLIAEPAFSSLSWDTCGGRNFSATSRPSLVSSAL